MREQVLSARLMSDFQWGIAHKEGPVSLAYPFCGGDRRATGSVGCWRSPMVPTRDKPQRSGRKGAMIGHGVEQVSTVGEATGVATPPKPIQSSPCLRARQIIDLNASPIASPFEEGQPQIPASTNPRPRKKLEKAFDWNEEKDEKMPAQPCPTTKRQQRLQLQKGKANRSLMRR
ncbi:hypothetical protein GOP47_0030573 [Adiantum capillus-veneris]|nr:hypothetical protein GOP47_0030573 [Adiantum capillus-veneris]